VPAAAAPATATAAATAVGSGGAVSAGTVLEEAGPATAAAVPTAARAPAAVADTAVNRVFNMREVGHACCKCLEDWWCQWRGDPDSTGQIQQYGRLFLHRQHLDMENNYLYRLRIPCHLQRQLCLLRCFNLQLGVHSHKPGTTRMCMACSGGHVETEQHLLHECSAYSQLRQRFGICAQQPHRCFQVQSAMGTAKFVQRAMLFRQGAASQPQPTHICRQSDTGWDWSRWLCLCLLSIWSVGWLGCILLCLLSAMEPMTGHPPSHMGP
jgi:hypothetical protein